MLKVARNPDNTFTILSDRPGVSGKGSFRQAIFKLSRLGVPVEDLEFLAEEFDKDRGNQPKHNLADFGMGFSGGKPRLNFTSFVDLEDKVA